MPTTNRQKCRNIDRQHVVEQSAGSLWHALAVSGQALQSIECRAAYPHHGQPAGLNVHRWIVAIGGKLLEIPLNRRSANARHVLRDGRTDLLVERQPQRGDLLGCCRHVVAAFPVRDILTVARFVACRLDCLFAMQKVQFPQWHGMGCLNARDYPTRFANHDLPVMITN